MLAIRIRRNGAKSLICGSEFHSVFERFPGLLELNFNSFPGFYFDETDVSVSLALKHCTQLTALQLCSGLEELDFLVFNSQIRRKKLGFCSARIFENESAAILKSQSQLKKISFTKYCEGLTDKSVLAIEQHCRNLTSIVLNHCIVTSQSVKELLKRCSMLKYAEIA